MSAPDPLLDEIITLRARVAVAEGTDERLHVARELWKAEDAFITRELAAYFAGEDTQPGVANPEGPLTSAALVAEVLSFTHPLPPPFPGAPRNFVPGGEHRP